MNTKRYYFYMMTNSNTTVLYIGVTGNLAKRVYEHKNQTIEDSFTSRYNLNKLVYFEEHCNPNSAIAREKQLKNWNRAWKDKLINKNNRYWEDLSEEWEG